MKLGLLLSALLLSALAIGISPATAEDVLDVDGHKLQSGVEYYILPVVRGRGGGLTLARRNGTCPFNVAQENAEVSQGLPLKFLPADQSTTIQVSEDVNIEFSAATICVQSTVWRLAGPDVVTGRRYVTTGGVTGNPGRETISNWFKIEKNGDDYKFVFCPTVCNICKVLCGDLGIFNEGGKRWLGFNGDPFPVMFKKG
ncbi:kunitz trypsin inhibitor 5-like [Tasmannia lanceolata]|uniref:kunitz trypsin inhibitor 5-like n=1 Tax=Tasmannia lanceolata TaxID=3420 RepID=UPI004063BF1A